MASRFLLFHSKLIFYFLRKYISAKTKTLLTLLAFSFKSCRTLNGCLFFKYFPYHITTFGRHITPMISVSFLLITLCTLNTHCHFLLVPVFCTQISLFKPYSMAFIHCHFSLPHGHREVHVLSPFCVLHSASRSPQ